MNREQFAHMLDSMAAGWTDREYESVAERFHEELFYSDPLNYAIFNKRDLLEFFTDDEGKPQACVFHDAVLQTNGRCGIYLRRHAPLPWHGLGRTEE